MHENQITTWQEAARQWKSGGTVWSAELGGIGPGYEQAIQVLLWEILARWGDSDVPGGSDGKYAEAYNVHVDKVVHELDEPCGGFSGAQVGAAKSTAYQFIRFGYKHVMDKLEKDRCIQVSKFWPSAPTPGVSRDL